MMPGICHSFVRRGINQSRGAIPAWKILFAVGLVCLALSSCSGSGINWLGSNAPNSTTPPPRVRMGVEAGTPPFESSGTDGSQLVGFDIDLMNTLASRAGFGVEYVQMEFNNMLKLVSECRLDGAISAIPIKEDLKQQMWLSPPYATARHVIVVKQGNIVINGRESLNGMVVGSQGGTLSELELRKIAGVTPKIYSSYYAAFQDLINGLIDAVIADQPRALSFVAVKRNRLKVTGEPFGEVQYGIAICIDHKDLAKKIEDQLLAMKSEGQIDKLAKKWKLNEP